MARRYRILSFVFLSACALLLVSAGGDAPKQAAANNWAMNATIIEACSCPMFCQCYFNDKPAAHGGGGHGSHGGGGEHYCKFNNAYKVNSGYYGSTDLAGAKFWVSGDLGPDFGKGQTNWAVATFDPSVSAAQREGIATILGAVYPVQWKSFSVAQDAKVDWTADKNGAVAKLDGGKAAEVVLTRFQGMSDQPVVIKNLRYWGAPRNDGFVLMPNQVEAYRLGDNKFEYNGTNGFMITFDINSRDVPAKPAQTGM